MSIEIQRPGTPVAINSSQTALPSAARTASLNSADITNLTARGAHIIVDISAIDVATQLIVAVQGKDVTSGNYYNILITTAINVIDTFLLKVHPEAEREQNSAVNDSLPKTFRIAVTQSDTNSITYSVHVNFLI